MGTHSQHPPPAAPWCHCPRFRSALHEFGSRLRPTRHHVDSVVSVRGCELVATEA
ncbi:hypothetical protein [Oryza sativa Japonica Group]|uniref:Uncharacterized protein n=1 Tax=Oryza sativa subsp. japonica TaxID=39947 RepID=Q941T7_ORYSJ|nr:hypothetical protein [Oryza sativa Japonica Group]